MTYEAMKELVNAAGLFRSEPATLPGRSMVRMKNNFFKGPLLHLVVASAMHVKGRGRENDIDGLGDSSSGGCAMVFSLCAECDVVFFNHPSLERKSHTMCRIAYLHCPVAILVFHWRLRS